MRVSALALLASATMVLAPLPSPANAATSVTTDQFSLGLAPEVTTSPGVPAGYIRLWDMGVAWRDVNPAPGVFNWTVLDQRIAQANAAGAKVLYVAGLTPVWAAANPTDGDPRWGAGSASAPADPATYGSFITALMQRYGARIAAVETWNEANLKTFWTGTPEQMADLTARANAAIKAISPGTAVFAASTTTRLINSVKTFFGPYAAALKAKGFPIDGWTIHTYPAANATPVNRFDAIDAWRDVLRSAINADVQGMGKVVWDTEINYGLAGPGAIPDQDFDGPTGATYLARTYVDSIRQGISATFWYLWTAGPYGLIGVQMYNGTKETIDAYNRLRSWTGGATLSSCDTTTDVVKCYFTKGEPFIIAMSKSGAPTAWNGSPNLNAEKWDGGVVNPVGTLALGIGPVKLTCGADKGPCSPGGVAAPSNGSGATNPAATAITIIGSAITPIKKRNRQVITGTAPELVGQQLIACYVTAVPMSSKMPLTKCLNARQSSKMIQLVAPGGSFTFINLAAIYPSTRRTISVFVQNQTGSVKSSSVPVVKPPKLQLRRH